MIKLSKRAYGLRGKMNTHPMPPEPPIPAHIKLAALQHMAGAPVGPPAPMVKPEPLQTVKPMVPRLQTMGKLNAMLNNQNRFAGKKIENV